MRSRQVLFVLCFVAVLGCGKPSNEVKPKDDGKAKGGDAKAPNKEVGKEGSKTTAADPAVLERDELAKLQGSWIMVETTALGKTIDEEEMAKSPAISMTIKDKTYRDRFGGTFEIDPTKTPKRFDKVPSAEATLAGRKQLGIYEFDGERLRIRMAMPSVTDRPPNFGPTDFAGYVTFVYKRAPKPADDKKSEE